MHLASAPPTAGHLRPPGLVRQNNVEALRHFVVQDLALEHIASRILHRVGNLKLGSQFLIGVDQGCCNLNILATIRFLKLF